MAKATHAVLKNPTNACVPSAHTLRMPITEYVFNHFKPSER
ncbi:hypothetical protein [Neisseria zalophi]|nr:hypothetical protein [Neisseria zalophi]